MRDAPTRGASEAGLSVGRCSGRRRRGRWLVVGGLAGAVADAAAAALRQRPPAHGRRRSTARTRPASPPPQQDRLLFAAFDVTRRPTAPHCVQLLKDWTAAAERLTGGLPVGPGVTVGPRAADRHGRGGGPRSGANLTLTFGVGPDAVRRRRRRPLRARRPAARRPRRPAGLPRRRARSAPRSGGDLCVQACGDDPQVAVPRHPQPDPDRPRGRACCGGRRRASAARRPRRRTRSTPRNLMGFKDGTDNIRADTDDFDRNVWVAVGRRPAWMAGGSYLVARRIRIRIEVWDRSSLQDQEQTIGRTKVEGAPLGAAERVRRGRPRRQGPRRRARHPRRLPRRAWPTRTPTSIHILRRGYNFTDGIDPRVGQLDAGLFFLAYQRDPRQQFIPLQQRLAGQDALNEYIQHVSSARVRRTPGSAPGRLDRPDPVRLTTQPLCVAWLGLEGAYRDTKRSVAIRPTRATSLVCISSSGRWTRAP